MRRRRVQLALAAAAVVVAVVVAALLGTGAMPGDDGGSRPASGPTDGGGGAPDTAADEFLARYVDPDGRVVRHDQGGDTVSEGQAYALLVTAAVGDEARFDRVWSWTRANLQRDDGLFAWRWQDGSVVDDEPAPDADIDIASALASAATRFDEPELLDEARGVAEAVLDHETATVAGERVLLAGRWAASERIVNPSYAARCDHADLARLTGDDRWLDLGEHGVEQVETFVEEGLPPDWAVLDDDGSARPIAAPDRTQDPGRYGLDAARIPARLSACPAGRDVAAGMWDRLDALDGDGAAPAYSLDGRPVEPGGHPLGLVGAAAAARSAGEEDESARLFAEATQLAERQPSYYGAAWLALGEVVLGLGGSSAEGDAAAVAAPTVRLAAAGRSVPVQDPSTTQPPPTTTTTATTSPPPSTTAPPTTDPTGTTVPPATTDPTDPGGTTVPPSPPGAGTDGDTSPTSSGAGPGGDGDDPTAGDGGRPDGTDTDRGRTASGGDTEGGGETGDLSSGAVTPGAALTEGGAASPGEPARRRTGAIALAGFAGTIGLAAVLGLRERGRALRAVRPPA